MYLLFLLIPVVGVIFFFTSSRLSPIPYFPSNIKDIDLIIKALSLKNNQIIIDLGAGDGLIVFEAAKMTFEKKLNTKFIAVEINPVLLLILHWKKFFHENKKNIQIVFGNMFKMNYSKLLPKHKSQITYYLYISPWFLEKTIANIKNQLKNFYIITYMYSIPKRKEIKKIKGKNNIFTYKF
ncbi:MAG: hypothetical protein HYW86_04850 [Candidatus Roizmanbacteria bacterium]|nr:MAG: hypothetical protein HYW86_04850 [Candidatus Roizmanbacteria bacterium]